MPAHCGSDETIIPECANSLASWTPIDIPPARALAISPMEVYGAFTVYASKPGGHSLGISWGDFLSWTQWLCFELVPYPSRLAATWFGNDLSEVFAVTECGELYARRIPPSGGWSIWKELGPPSGASFLTDVSASLSKEHNLLYVADRGEVFVRSKATETDVNYGDWRATGVARTKLLAAGIRPDGRQQLFTLDDAGEPRSCVQTATEIDSSFEECFDFDSEEVPELVDIEVPLGPANGLLVFALDAMGAIWSREQDVEGAFGSWGLWRDDQPTTFTAIAAAGLRDEPIATLFFLGVERSGVVWQTVRRNGAWSDWGLYPP